MHIVFHHPCSKWLQQRIEAMAGSHSSIEYVADAAGTDLNKAIARADVLLHVLYPVTETIMDAAPNLKLIQKIGVGLDAIDLDAAKQRNIAVCNMPGTNTQAVVEMTLGLMFGVLRGIPALDHRLRSEGIWALPTESQGQFGEIAGKVVGLVGYGNVARRLEVVLEALGAKVLISSRSSKINSSDKQVTKEALLAQVDILSLHIPENQETRHWLDAKAIAALKPGAIVINTARGGLIDEEALVVALTSGKLAGAGLDVYKQEPLQEHAAILSAPNVVALPHVAWLTRETLDRSLAAAFENIERLIDGRALCNQSD
jgi:phosphoglycerate dehydrogenase-like enzyme